MGTASMTRIWAVLLAISVIVVQGQHYSVGCSSHTDCGEGKFCTAESRCEPHLECHYGHDAIDGVCPQGEVRGSLKAKKSSKSVRHWGGLRRYDEYRGDGAHDSLWFHFGGSDPS